MLHGGLVIRPVKSVQEVEAVVNLTAEAFQEEVKGVGLTSPQWQGLEKDHLVNNPELWRHVGVAVENGVVLGVAVLKFHGGRERHLTMWQMVLRIGLLATLWSLISNQLLVDDLGPHDALADMIVVAPQARGRGIGVALMRWLEAASTAEYPMQPLVNLFLWVAADTPAVHLYERAGFKVAKRTSDDSSAWLMRHVLHSFLGHGTWMRMVKSLSQPRPVGPTRPLLKQLSMKTIEGIPEGRAVGVMWPPTEPMTDPEIIDRPQKMVFWRTMSGRVDLSTGEDWRIRANVEDEMDDKDLSDEELIRRFEESVGAPGVPLSQRLPKLDQEGMDLTPDLGSSMRTSNKGLDALHCTDPLTQDGQKRIWRLQHQKSFDKAGLGTELPVGDGNWMGGQKQVQATVKAHVAHSMQGITSSSAVQQSGVTRRPARSSSGTQPHNVVIDFKR